MFATALVSGCSSVVPSRSMVTWSEVRVLDPAEEWLMLPSEVEGLAVSAGGS
jgi:hypothetical protein